MNRKFFIRSLFLGLCISCFSQLEDHKRIYVEIYGPYEGILSSRVIEWISPVTDWTWDRRIYYKIPDNPKWYEFTNIVWQPTKVSIKDNFILGWKFKLIFRR